MVVSSIGVKLEIDGFIHHQSVNKLTPTPVCRDKFVSGPDFGEITWR